MTNETPNATPDPYLSACQQMEVAANLIGLDVDQLEILKKPKRELTVNFPVEMDDGSTQVFTGYRIQHNDARGPYKGGIRYAKHVSLNEIKAMAIWMTWKTAIVNVPYGGAKGGVVVDPASLSRNELENLSRRFITELEPIIGPDRDIPAPDMGTDSTIMAWMMDTYSMGRGHTVPAIVTGKPIAVGGSLGRFEATGRGVLICIEELARCLGEDLQGQRVVVQGAGQVGSVAAKLLDRAGAKITAISDANAGYYNGDGLDLTEIFRLQDQRGTIFEKPKNADQITNSQLLEIDCDYLIPAAIENVISNENAEKIQANVIVEAANGPTTPEAEAILLDRGITIVPDILANSGGVTVSYMEWVQDLQSFFWEEKEVNRRLAQIMRRAFGEVWTISQERHLSLRDSAHFLAINRVLEAIKIRGVFP